MPDASAEAPARSRPPRELRRPRAGVALGFALAALAAAWNPIAAPFGLVVGLGATALAIRALRRSPRRGLARAALAVAIAAAVLSVAVLVLTAGAVGVDLPGEPVVRGRTPAELDDALRAAAERTRAERGRAARELERLTGPAADGGAPRERAGGAAAPGPGAGRQASEGAR
jgi:hypothetical protein